MPKPRLSMKLLWKLYSDFHTQPAKTDITKLGMVKYFLEFVESEMKSPTPGVL